MTRRQELHWASFNSVGRLTEVTVLAPIRQGRVPGERRTYEERLRDAIETIQTRADNGLPTSLNKVQSIHFGRLIIIRPEQYLTSARNVGGVEIAASGYPEPIDVFAEVPRAGGEAVAEAEDQGTAPHLPSLLLVLVEFDGDPAVYFRDIADKVAGEFDLVLQNCVDFPGTRSFEKFWRWIRRYQMRSDLFLPVYPDLSTVRIKALQDFRRRFDEFAARVRSSREGGAANIDELFDDFLRETEQAARGFPDDSGLFANGRQGGR